MPNEEMMMMEQMQGETPSMPPSTEMPPELIMMMEQQGSQDMMPEGGISSMSEVLKQAAQLGRNGDMYMVHASQGDTVIPMDVLNENPQLKDMLFAQISDMGYDPERYIVGNELNSINPETGMPEFFFKKLLKIAVPIALAAFAPYALPAGVLGGTGSLATAAGGLAGTLASAAGAGIGTLLTGGNLKQAGLAALGTGITSGLTKALTPTDALAATPTDAARDASTLVGGKDVGVDIVKTNLAPSAKSFIEGDLDAITKASAPSSISTKPLTLSPDIGRSLTSDIGRSLPPSSSAISGRPFIQGDLDAITRTGRSFSPAPPKPYTVPSDIGRFLPTSPLSSRPPISLSSGDPTQGVTLSSIRPPSDPLSSLPIQEPTPPPSIKPALDNIDIRELTKNEYIDLLQDDYGLTFSDAVKKAGMFKDTDFRDIGFYERFLGTKGQSFDDLPLALKYGLPIAAIGGIGSLAGAFKTRMGDQPETFGDPTQEEIDALRFGFNRYPSNIRYNPVVAGNVRYGNQGGLSNALPVRKMQSGGINIDYTLRPAQQLESINQLYGQEFGESNLSETDWINSSRFGEFENAVKDIYSSFGASDIQQMTKDLLTQEERASDQNSPYAPSAQRIAMTIRGRLNQFGINPNPFDPNPPAPPPPDPQPQPDPDPQTQPQPNPQGQGQGSDYRVEFGPNGEPYIVGSDGNMFMGGAGTATGIGGLISSRPNIEGNVSTGIGSEGTSLFANVPTKLPPPTENRPTPYTYYAPNLATVQGIRGLQPEVADLSERFRGGVQDSQPVQMKLGGDPMMYGDRPDGLIRGPMGIEEDIIPADLMPGEFVFTKDAVEGVGKLAGGGMKEGIKSMYGLMKKFEGVA